MIIRALNKLMHRQFLSHNSMQFLSHSELQLTLKLRVLTACDFAVVWNMFET